MKKLLILGLSALALVGCATTDAPRSPADVAALPLCPDALGRTEPPGLFAKSVKDQGLRASCRCPSGKPATARTFQTVCWQPGEHIAALHKQKTGEMTVPWGEAPGPRGRTSPTLDSKPGTPARPAPASPTKLPTLD